MALLTKKKSEEQQEQGASPKVWTEAELDARAQDPDALREHLRAHRAAARTLTRKGDPGRSLPAVQAKQARAEHLATLERHVEEARRMEYLLAPLQEMEQRVHHIGRRGWAKEMHKGAHQAQLDAMHASMAERAREREARKEAQRLAAKITHPPDPRAESITAAMLSDPFLVDGLRRVKRSGLMPDEFGHEVETVTSDPLFEPEDIVVAHIMLRLLEDTNPLVIREPASNGKWPAGCGFPAMPGLARRIKHLAGNGIFSTGSEAAGMTVTYGWRAKEVADRWGISTAAP